jgi:hypothetical protein
VVLAGEDPLAQQVTLGGEQRQGRRRQDDRRAQDGQRSGLDQAAEGRARRQAPREPARDQDGEHRQAGERPTQARGEGFEQQDDTARRSQGELGSEGRQIGGVHGVTSGRVAT